MNFGKINMVLLIVVIVIAAGILYLLFMNKKSSDRQDDALAEILKQVRGDRSYEEEESITSLQSSAPSPSASEPTAEEWNLIYSASESIYRHATLSPKEATVYKKFGNLVNDDLEFLKVFYPVCDKFEKGEALTDDDKAFYEANAALVEKEINHRKEKAAGSKLKAEGSKESAETSQLTEQPEIPAAEESSLESRTLKPELPNPGDTSDLERLPPLNHSAPPLPPEELQRANPPLAQQERNQIILSFFEDGTPKTAKSLLELFKGRTGHDYGKNMHRVLGSMEGKFLTPLKVNKITYYCLPEWFEGRKLKPEYKQKMQKQNPDL